MHATFALNHTFSESACVLDAHYLDFSRSMCLEFTKVYCPLLRVRDCLAWWLNVRVLIGAGSSGAAEAPARSALLFTDGATGAAGGRQWPSGGYVPTPPKASS
eukprot:COSAG05_NODE_3094_length_2326_cov_10.375842_4_plen_103_part_00